MCKYLTPNKDLILGNIYGYNSLNQNKKLFSEITRTVRDLKQRYPSGNLIFRGDYNMVIDEWLDEWLDRSSSKYQGQREDKNGIQLKLY